MKKIQKEITTYKDIFVSVDGKEFNNEADCKTWESSYKGTLAASWNSIKKEEVCSCKLSLPYSNADHECYVVMPKDINEIALINAYLISSTDSGEIRLTADHIGKLLALDFGYDHYYCDIYILEDHIKKTEEYITELKNKMCKENTEE